MSAKSNMDRKNPSFPWTARQKRAKMGNRKSRKMNRRALRNR